MIEKSNLEKQIEMGKGIAEKYGLDELSDEFEQTAEINQNYKMRMLFIGGFSAGKSALINCMIGSEKLAENQAPETAIAAEVSFGEEDVLFAVDLNGNAVEYTDTDVLDVNELSHLEYTCSSENMRKIKDYVLVDTPGFDSGIERHNKALMQYIGDKGTAFIFVVDCERGTLSYSAINYLNEVSHYSNDIAVIINKCDKKTDEDIEKIKKHINELIIVNCGKECPIITTSKYDEDVASKIAELMMQFSPQALYEKNMGNYINSKVQKLVRSLKTIEKNKTLDVSSIEMEIERREATQRSLIETMNRQKEKASRMFCQKAKSAILEKVNIQLNHNVKVLATAYKSGLDSFQEKIVSIVRPIIVGTIEEYEPIAYENILNDIKTEDLGVDVSLDEEYINRLLGVAKTMVDGASAIVEKFSDIQTADSQNRKKRENVYKVLTSVLAITTNVIAPILELLIVFLPDIFGLFKKRIESSQEQKLMDAIRQDVIPQIVSKLEIELDNPLGKVGSVIVENVEQSISEIIDSETEALEQAKKQKEQREQDFEKFVAELREDIALFE